MRAREVIGLRAQQDRLPEIHGETGKTNSFYQNANLYLCLNDENGKGVWGVPFKQPLCGYVESIDYYGNGKIGP